MFISSTLMALHRLARNRSSAALLSIVMFLSLLLVSAFTASFEEGEAHNCIVVNVHLVVSEEMPWLAQLESEPRMAFSKW